MSENLYMGRKNAGTATVGDVTVKVTPGVPVKADVVITLSGNSFKNVSAGDDVTPWFTNIPAGLNAKVKSIANGKIMTVTLSGMPV
jgi:hypothetical protein